MEIVTRNTKEIKKQKQLNNSSKITNEDKKISEKEEREMINIIAILLDRNLSFEERLRRVGRAPTSGAVVNEFKKILIKEFTKNRNLILKLNKEKDKSLKNGILGLRLEDLVSNSILNPIIKIVMDYSISKKQENNEKITKEIIVEKKQLYTKDIPEVEQSKKLIKENSINYDNQKDVLNKKNKDLQNSILNSFKKINIKQNNTQINFQNNTIVKDFINKNVNEISKKNFVENLKKQRKEFLENTNNAKLIKNN